MSSNRRTSFPVNALRRSPRRRTKTPSVNELSKKCKLSPRGKRRLEFKHEKTLKGRTFYLDLPGYRKISSLQTRIKELGGVVEEFLSKDISCVVTNRKDADTGCSPRSNSTPSPILSIPSPFPGNTKSSSAKGSAVPSPLSADSAGAEQTGPPAPKHNIRGKALAAQAAITCKYGTSNIIANARNWGLEIMQLEQMLEKLEKYGSVEKKPMSNKPLVSGRTAKQGVKPKVRKLYAPFIKVEDHSRCYKPLVHELKEWPKIYFDGPLGSCPFDSPKIDLESDHDGRDKTKRKPVQEDKNKKKGFCECCCVHYEDLDLHLHSDRHQSFARDSSNYRSLDELIKKGPSLQDFLEKMLLKHEQKKIENQAKIRSELLTPGKCSVTEDEQKAPTKENSEEILPNCQTPIEHTPDEDTDCHTPTNPSYDRKSACHTPTTHSSPEKNSADDDTPTRVLRPRGGKNDVTVGETHTLRSSPRTPNAVKESKNKELCTPKRKESNSEKTSDRTPEKRAAHAKARSTSSSPVAASSTRSKRESSHWEERVSQTPEKTRPEAGKMKSSTHEEKVNDAETRECVRTRRHRSDSSDESSSKENNDPESLVDCRAKETAGDLVGRSKLRSESLVDCRTKETAGDEDHMGPSKLRSQSVNDCRVKEPAGDKNHVERSKLRSESQLDCQAKEMAGDKDHVGRSKLRSGTTRGGQQPRDRNGDENENRVESKTDVKDDFKQDIETASPTKASLRSATKMNSAQALRNPELPTTEGETSAVEMKIGSPRRTSLRSVTKMSPAQESMKIRSPSTGKESSAAEVDHVGRSKLRSGTPRGGQQPRDRNEDEHENRVESKTDVKDDFKQDIETASPTKPSLRSAAKMNSAQELRNPELPTTEGESSAVEMKIGSPRRTSLRSVTKMSPAQESIKLRSPSTEKESSAAEVEKGKCVTKMSPAQELKNPEPPKTEGISQSNTQKECRQELETTSPRRSSLRSAAKISPVQELKNPELPTVNEETSTVEEKLERNRRSRTTKQFSDNSTGVSEKKASETSSSDVQITVETALMDHVARLTRSRVQSAPAAPTQSVNDLKSIANYISSPVTQEITDEEKQEIPEDRRRSRHRAAEHEKVDTRSSRGNTEEADKSDTTTQILNCTSRGSEVVADVKVQLSDCRLMVAGRNRPVLERESDESETESIQLSKDESYSPCKEESTNNSSSEEEKEAISSTPTLDPCPSSPSSEKSGYSEERCGYSLRKRTEQQEQEPSVSRRTRSSYKVPDEQSKYDRVGGRERSKTVSLPFTNVKSKSPKQRCKSVRHRENNTPERKRVENRRAMKSPLRNSPRRKVPRLKEPSSESDSSAFSSSPHSGPIRETRSRHAMTRSAVRSLNKVDSDAGDADASSILSGTTASLGDLSTIAVCGTPRHVNPTDYNLAGNCSKARETSLSEMELSKKQRSQSVGYLAKDRKAEPRIPRLFDSDDEDEDFYGFNVPQFDGSFSSEGDLSYKINSIVESMNNGDGSQDTIDDDENVTIQEDKSEDIKNEDVLKTNRKAIERREASTKEQIHEKTAAKNKEINKRETARKRKSTSQIESASAEANTVESDCQYEGRSFSDFYMKLSSVIDDRHDVDEDDDVFSTVSDSSDGEEEEVASPFSITSWRQKRKSEDLQPEADRPAKRRKSLVQWSGQTMTEPSTQSSMSETPVKYRMDRGIGARKEYGNQKPTRFTSKLDEMLQEDNRSRVQSFSTIDGCCEFYAGYSDEPVYQTLEERVKLRRLRNISQKARENSSLPAQNRDTSIQESQAKIKTLTEKTEELQKAVLRMKPLIPSTKDTLPLKSLKTVTPLRSSSRLNRANSSPSVSQSPLATPSGKPRRATWIYDVSKFASPPSEVPSFGGKRFRCSTPASANPTKHALRLRSRDKMASRNSSQNDAYAFDE